MYTFFLSALEIRIILETFILILIFIITAMVYLWSWSISTHMATFLIPDFLLEVWKATILDIGKEYLFHTKTVKPLMK